jgi:hypothetical protein
MMASLAALWNYPQSPAEFAMWTFNHAATHQDINRFISQQFAPNGQPGSGLVLPSYVLDPTDPRDLNATLTWAYQHAIMHQNQNAVLGIAGQDLTELDWQDAEAMAGWFQDHSNEHLQAAQKLGIP